MKTDFDGGSGDDQDPSESQSKVRLPNRRNVDAI